MKKKLVALLLVLVMLFNVLPIGVFANGDTGSDETSTIVDEVISEVESQNVQAKVIEETKEDFNSIVNETKSAQNTNVGLSYADRMKYFKNVFEVAAKAAENIKERRAQYGDRLTQQLLAAVVRTVSKVLSVSDWALQTTKLPGLTKRKVQNIMTLGDSTVMGYGFDDLITKNGCFGFTSQQAYPAYLASKYGLSNYYQKSSEDSDSYERATGSNKTDYELAQFAITATTTIDIREMLGVEEGLNSGDDPRAEAIQDQIHNCDLITVGFGGNDVMQNMILPLLISAYIKEIPSGQLEELNPAIRKYIENYNMDSVDKVNGILKPESTLNDQQIDAVKKAAEAITKFFETIMQGNNTQEAINAPTNTSVYFMLLSYAIYAESFSKIVKDIHYLNRGAKIAIMGLFNPLNIYYNKYEKEGIEETKIDLTLLGDIMFSYLNAAMKKTAMENRSFCCYVNCKGVEMNVAADWGRNLAETDSTDDSEGVWGVIAQLSKVMSGEQGIAGFMGFIHQSPQGHHDTYVKLMEEALCQPHHAHSLQLKKVGLNRYAYKCVDSLCSANGIAHDHCNDPWYEGCGQLFKDPYGRTLGSLTYWQLSDEQKAELKK